MNPIHPAAIETIKDKTVAGIKGTEHIAEKTIDGTAHIVKTAAKDAEVIGIKTERATANAASGAIKKAEAMGTAAINVVRHHETKPTDRNQAEVKVPETAESNS